MFEGVDTSVRAALGSRFTGAVVRIEHRGRPVFERAYGTVDDAQGSVPVDVTTRFDLASITKPFVATAALELVRTGTLTLDASLASFFGAWRGTAREAITLRMLLAHTSGMNSGADYRRLLGHNVERFAISRDLVAQPGEKVIYSDLGFITLGAVIERATGRSLRSNLAAVSRRLGSGESADFLPRLRDRPRIPATEDDGWRGRVRGLVHDEKAYLMGGVAGHAGLFGTAASVAALTEAYLAAAAGRPTPLDHALARSALEEQAFDPVLRRGLGWALKTRDDNSCGALMSGSTFGHTGFVGTCVWADPERDFQVVFLTNAVYFGRNDLRDVRISVCDAAGAELI